MKKILILIGLVLTLIFKGCSINEVSSNNTDIKNQLSSIPQTKNVIVNRDKHSRLNGQVKSEIQSDTYNSRVIQTGSRGGKFYINKNGNKTYIKKGK